MANYRRAGQRVWSTSLDTLATIQYYMVGREPLHYCLLVGEGDDLKQAIVPASDLRTADGCCDGCSRWLPASSFNQGYRGEVSLCFLCYRSERGLVVGWNPWVDQQHADLKGGDS